MSRGGKVIHAHSIVGNISPEYRSWTSMCQRCYNPSLRDYSNYGARGITVCERWRNSFEAFLADMGLRPKGTTLDRINNEGNYEPGNCRWATLAEQHRNRRDNRLVTFRGKTQCLAAWAEELGMSHHLLQSRLAKWPVERAFTQPVRHW